MSHRHLWIDVWLVANNVMLFYFLCCFVILTSAFPEIDLISEKSIVSDGSQARISGGHVLKNTRKYQVQISRRVETSTSLEIIFCSGVIYNQHHILTTAGCVRGARLPTIGVRGNSNERGEGVEIRIKRIIRHPKNKRPVYDYDIAVLRTVKDLNVFGEAVHIAPTGTKLPETVQLSGWGKIAAGYSDLTHDLRAVVVPLINNNQCQELYPGRNISEHMICAHNFHNENGACQGDEGDPAMEKDTKRLIGIVSFTYGCDNLNRRRKPTVMVFVQEKAIRDFITANTKVKRKYAYKKPKDEDDEASNDETPLVRPEQEQPEKPLERPEHGQSQHGEPEHGESEHGKSEHGEPEYGEPEHERPEHGRSEHGRPENGRPEHGRSKHERFEMPSERPKHERPEGPSGQLENERPERSSRQLEHVGPEKSSEQLEHEGPERSSGQLEHEHPERSSPLTLKSSSRPLQRHRISERPRSSAETLLGEL